MQKNKRDLNIFYFLILPFSFYLLTFFGCATVPTGSSLPTYSINGVTYLSLAAVCNQKGINWDYDIYSKTITLSKENHKINLMVGQNLVLVDSGIQHLRHRVDFYQNQIVVPYKFKEQIIDVLFKESLPGGRAADFVLPLSNIKKIIVDAGHGGFDPGTIGRTGIKEKEINLDIAKRLAKILKEEGVDVTMTRSSDNFISLQRRVDIANRSGADLFLSIHSNANRVRSLNGFEVYHVSANASDSQRQRYGLTDQVLNMDRSYYERMTPDLKATLTDMINTYSRAESIGLAQNICQTVNRDLDTKILGIKNAGFYILKGARMPAILIEVGFLSNSNEEQLLRDTSYRQEIAESIARGVNNYAKDCRLAQERM